jgi:UDP-3-O-[3-hydroxymyristoyl] glucosamine N-acyltransferase
MPDPLFFKPSAPFTLSELATLSGAELRTLSMADLIIKGVAPLDAAKAQDLTFLDNPAYASQIIESRAGACITSQRFADRVPAHMALLLSNEPYKAYARVLEALFPEAMRPMSVYGSSGVAPGAYVHPEAHLEQGVILDPGVVVGRGAYIGEGTIIAANTVIGVECRIGRGCSIGPNASLSNALIGDRVIIHAGARIGQDGFGFAMGPRGHAKVPQIGRVIIQDDVEIGANTTIDRGANRDTIVGEGTKIDNLVQIAHNVVIGRHCVIVSQVGISGSTTLEDFVVLGGQVGVVGHVRIGMGAQVAGSSNIAEDIPAGARWGGTPAKPIKDWFREVAWLKRMSKRESKKED